MESRSIQEYFVSAPWGGLKLCMSNEKILRIEFLNRDRPEMDERVDVRLVKGFSNYFLRNQSLHNMKIQLNGTPFQKRVWKALTDIPVGTVSTYMELASEIGSGARAVANACRNNPCPVIIPCHRVVAKNSLGGFAGQTEGWLMEVKRYLLKHEGYEIDD